MLFKNIRLKNKNNLYNILKYSKYLDDKYFNCFYYVFAV